MYYQPCFHRLKPKPNSMTLRTTMNGLTSLFRSQVSGLLLKLFIPDKFYCNPTPDPNMTRARWAPTVTYLEVLPCERKTPKKLFLNHTIHPNTTPQ